jgi:hypothetical protein
MLIQRQVDGVQTLIVLYEMPQTRIVRVAHRLLAPPE